MKNRKGFTLAELLVVVAIIAVLVAIAIPVFTTQLEKSREAVDAANIRAEYAELIKKYSERTLKALNVGKGGNKPRKDIENWKQACDFMSFYYDETFKVTDEMPVECDDETRKVFFAKYLESYDHNDDSSAWFEKVKAITEELGFAAKPKDFKKNPEMYKGSIVHITNMLRIALTGRANAPDIHEVSHVLGEDITRARLQVWA